MSLFVELDVEIYRRHRNIGERPFQRFGVCPSCGRHRDAEGRLLWITGRRRRPLVCVECFGVPRRRRSR